AADGRIVHATVLPEDFKEAGAEASHSEGLIDLLSQAEGADVVLSSTPAGESTRVSVRTRPGGVDATVLTGRFGGGGHSRAAGATGRAATAEGPAAVRARAHHE